MKNNLPQYFNLSVSQVGNIIEVIYTYDSHIDGEVSLFPSYTLFLKQQKQGRQIFVGQISLSIDYPSFSQRISDNRAVFLGLTSYKVSEQSSS